MKTSAIVPAQVDFSGEVPFAPAFGDVYHARAGAFAQAREVFLAGNGLPARWRGRERFVVLETGFGLGNNFLATWAAWRADPERSPRLVFISIEKHPLRASDMAQAHATSPAPELAAQLLAAWPPLTPGLHTLSFEGGAVTLLLAWGDLADWLPELQAPVDAIFLDGFAPARNAPMWDAYALRSLTRLAAPGATAATWSVARSVRDALAGAGFEVQRAPGFGGKREMTVAAITPNAAERRHAAPPGRRPAPLARRALVIGAGLAGASAAWALAREGLQVTVLDSAAQPASGASGNPAGLFHGVVHAHDGAHAQWLRAAALRATQVYRPLVAAGRVAGAVDGLLRGAGAETLDTMLALVQHQALPADYVQARSHDQAAALAGCALAGPAWHYPGGGWLQPGALVHHWLADPNITLLSGRPVAALRPLPGAGWQALDAQGKVQGEGGIAIVAAAEATPALLAPHSDAAGWTWRRTRGQLTIVPKADAAPLPRPRLPLASGGYLMSLPDGGLLCGATSQPGDDEPELRADDHRANLAQIGALTGAVWEYGDLALARLGGRVAWRWGCDDRLPVLGAVPLPAQALQGARRLEQPRHVPRVPGLYVFSGLGSRGITWAPLLGETLAALVTGAPLPVASSLMETVDPARFVARAQRQAAR